MLCPVCGLNTWNYEPGTLRCPNNHVTVVSEAANAPGVADHLRTLQDPKRFDRLQLAASLACGALGGVAVEVVVHVLG